VATAEVLYFNFNALGPFVFSICVCVCVCVCVFSTWNSVNPSRCFFLFFAGYFQKIWCGGDEYSSISYDMRGKVQLTDQCKQRNQRPKADHNRLTIRIRFVLVLSTIIVIWNINIWLLVWSVESLDHYKISLNRYGVKSDSWLIIWTGRIGSTCMDSVKYSIVVRGPSQDIIIPVFLEGYTSQGRSVICIMYYLYAYSIWGTARIGAQIANLICSVVRVQSAAVVRSNHQALMTRQGGGLDQPLLLTCLFSKIPPPSPFIFHSASSSAAPAPLPFLSHWREARRGGWNMN